MALPFPTTRISLLQPRDADSDSDDWGTAPDPDGGYGVVASGIRAHLSGSGSGSATSSSSGGEGGSELVRYRLLCDPCELAANMRVRDDVTGLVYDVAWVTPRPEPMSHLVAGVTRSTGTS
jgi:hypothetical protein